MSPFRVSIRGLMALVFFVAVGFVSLRFASEGWAGLVWVLTLALLASAVLGIVYRRGARRAFWVGFALMGSGYLAMSAEWFWRPVDHRVFRVTKQGGAVFESTEHPTLITTEILDMIEPSLHAYQRGTMPRGLLDPSGGDASSRAVLRKLEEQVPMPFDQETPLAQVLQSIKTATTGADMPQGLPIFVDPVGLREAQQSMASPITLKLDGVPLKKSLKLLLKQLDLTYRVRDGLLVITATSSTSLISEDEDPLIPFRKIGHCLWALIAAALGGLAGRAFFATREGRVRAGSDRLDAGPERIS